MTFEDFDAAEFVQGLRKWREAIAAEFKVLARTKKLQPAPASDFPQLARLLSIEDSDEDLRVALKAALAQLNVVDDEGNEAPVSLVPPVMALLGLIPRTEHKGIGERQRYAAKLRHIEPTSMRRHEAKMAEELGYLLRLYPILKDSDFDE